MGSETMQILIKIYLFVIAATALIACKSLNKDDRLKEKLVGKWKLDSVSTPNMKFERAGITEIYNFKNSTDFTREWEDYDVGNTLTGKYIFYINSNRSLGTISFVSNFQISGNDTIRIDIPNLDIIELNDDRLHVLEPTKIIDVKGKPSIVFNKHCIYKRIK
jgi:hypothetical protein